MVKDDTLRWDTASRKVTQQNTAENSKSPIKIIVETDPKLTRKISEGREVKRNPDKEKEQDGKHIKKDDR